MVLNFQQIKPRKPSPGAAARVLRINFTSHLKRAGFPRISSIIRFLAVVTLRRIRQTIQGIRLKIVPQSRFSVIFPRRFIHFCVSDRGYAIFSRPWPSATPITTADDDERKTKTRLPSDEYGMNGMTMVMRWFDLMGGQMSSDSSADDLQDDQI